jgi:hypothetical protein
LTGDSEILDIARELSALIRAQGLDAAVIGGVAVVLHGHIRTTLDVDVYAADPMAIADILKEHGFKFEKAARQFVKNGIPVHLVTLEQVGEAPAKMQDIDGIRTVSLADLLSMKLRSGIAHILRAQDLADVIGLIRHHELGGEFTPRIAKPVRAEFRKLVRAIAKQQSGE